MAETQRTIAQASDIRALEIRVQQLERENITLRQDGQGRETTIRSEIEKRDAERAESVRELRKTQQSMQNQMHDHKEELTAQFNKDKEKLKDEFNAALKVLTDLQHKSDIKLARIGVAILILYTVIEKVFKL